MVLETAGGDANGYDPYKSDCDPVLLKEGVPDTLANGPASVASFADPLDSASLSSPATKVVNLFHTDPETFSRLGFPIQEADPCIGVCFNRAVKSSNCVKNSE